MSVDLKILNLKNNEIDLATGLDFGLSRKRVANIFPIKIKNTGDVTARDVILSASTKDDSSETDEAEYAKQQLAASWKSFSKLQDGVYTKQLSLGNIHPHEFAQGIKEHMIDFSVPEKCKLTEVFRSGEVMVSGGKFTLSHMTDGIKDGTATRYAFEVGDFFRDVEIECNLAFSLIQGETNAQNPMVIFPVRIDSKGDKLGYLFMFQFRRSDNKYMISIWKDGTGIESHYDRVYGTKIFDTISWKTFDPTKKVSVKIYNNLIGQPTFECKYDNQNLILQKTGMSSIQGISLSDTAPTSYSGEGKIFMDLSIYTADQSISITNMKIMTEELEQIIYLKSVLGDNAADKEVYKSAVIVSYTED